MWLFRQLYNLHFSRYLEVICLVDAAVISHVIGHWPASGVEHLAHPIKVGRLLQPKLHFTENTMVTGYNTVKHYNFSRKAVMAVLWHKLMNLWFTFQISYKTDQNTSLRINRSELCFIYNGFWCRRPDEQNTWRVWQRGTGRQGLETCRHPATHSAHHLLAGMGD